MKTKLTLAAIAFVVASLFALVAACAPEKAPVKMVHISFALTGDGVIISTPDGIVCGTRCSADMPEGTHLTLQARADPGSHLASWGGNCATTTGEIVDLKLESELVCTAQFEKVTQPPANAVTHKLTVVALGPGSVVATPDDGSAPLDCRDTTCSAPFAEHATISVAATADPGAEVVGFSDDCTAQSATEGQVTLDADRVCTVSFFSTDDVTYPVRVQVVGDGLVTSDVGNIHCDASQQSCEGRYAGGTTVILTATATGSGTFQGWGQGCAGVDGPAVQLDVNYGIACSATFDHQLSLAVVGQGTIAGPGVSCSNVCATTIDTVLALTETPAPGFAFAGWSGDCTGDASATTTNVAPTASSCTATFTRIPPTLTVVVDGDGGVTSDDGSIACPTGACSTEVINHPAIANADATSWTCNPFLEGTHFGCNCGCGVVDPDCASPSVSACQFFTGCAQEYVVEDQNNLCYVEPHGGTPSVTLTATPTSGSSFAGWSGGCSGTDPVVTVSVSASLTCTATFTTP